MMKYLVRVFALILTVVPLLASAQVLQQALGGSDRIAARFEQVVLDERGAIIDRSTGQMWISRPGKFRWEYDGDDAQMVIGDGRTVWIVDRGLEQVIIRQQDRAMGRTPASVLAGNSNLDQLFLVVEEPQGDRTIATLNPRNLEEGGYEQLQFVIEDGEIRSFQIRDALGQTSEVYFSDYQIDGADDVRYGVDIPDNYDVIDERE